MCVRHEGQLFMILSVFVHLSLWTDWGDKPKPIEGNWSTCSAWSSCQIPSHGNLLPFRHKERDCTNLRPKLWRRQLRARNQTYLGLRQWQYFPWHEVWSNTRFARNGFAIRLMLFFRFPVLVHLCWSWTFLLPLTFSCVYFWFCSSLAFGLQCGSRFCLSLNV